MRLELEELWPWVEMARGGVIPCIQHPRGGWGSAYPSCLGIASILDKIRNKLLLPLPSSPN